MSSDTRPAGPPLHNPAGPPHGSPAGPPSDLAPARAAFIAPETRWFRLPGELPLELGGRLPHAQVAYRTWGTLDPEGGNCVVVCHALTGSADVDRWWTQMFGPGQALDPDRDFVVCANILGSCYGTTGPTSADPVTGRPWLGDFPAYTVRDMVRLQRELLRMLGVRRVRMAIGGSLGGMQTLEWALMYPELVEAIVPIANPARHSPWAIGLSEAQRQAIFADPLWRGGRYDPGQPPAAGLAAARMMAMCTYRSRESFEERFGRRPQTADLFAVESYLRYQGQQLVDRFDAATYVGLTQAMDRHDVARGRGDHEEVLRGLKAPALVVSIPTDVLYFPAEQEELVRLIPHARLARLESPHGHDAFLIEVEALSAMVAAFRSEVEGRRPPRAAPRGAAARPQERISLLVLGKGRVGSSLLEQVRAQRRSLESDYDFSLKVVGLADSRRSLLDESGLDLERWREALAAAPEAGPVDAASARPLLDRLRRLPAPVLLDLTAADGMEAVYEEAFRRGIHVVSANKRPLAAPRAVRERLFAARRAGHCHYHYETTVGASLPVIDTLKNLVRTGDRVRLVEGSLSGTLGFALSEAAKRTPLSMALRWARELGYTEPDPRQDLSGLDSARKAVILARELGLDVEVGDVRLEPFVPSQVTAPGTAEALTDALRGFEASFAARVQRAAEGGCALRYLARIEVATGLVSVGFDEVDAGHRAARLRDVEAYVAFTTDRYRESPLLVQGAGVGGAITAGGVLADVLRVAAALGVRASWSG
ncbi:MAG TPA: homoserine O-acetyltransferase [Anaeromyxobacteraceae bacterium]|nr:homoserine O-acetyltransferase [Anaeromyxobacteraceae bacterium]